MAFLMLNDLNKIFKALYDPTRLKIIALLSQQPLCVCVITEALGLAQPTISRHLSLLEQSGIIAKKRRGKLIIYGLKPSNDFCSSIIKMTIEHITNDREVALLLKRLYDLKVKAAFPFEEFNGLDDAFLTLTLNPNSLT